MNTKYIILTSKNRIFALLFSVFFGFLGGDHFYLGKRKSGLIKMCTLGGAGVWWALDAILLLTDAMLYSLGEDNGMVKDAYGKNLKYGLSIYRIKNRKVQRDWFRSTSV